MEQLSKQRNCDKIEREEERVAIDSGLAPIVDQVEYKGNLMIGAKWEMESLRRISVNVLVPYEQPIEAIILKPAQFTGCLELKPYRSISIRIDVSQMRAPLTYSFQNTSPDLHIFYNSFRECPSFDKCEFRMCNKPQFVYPPAGHVINEKIFKFGTVHCLTVESTVEQRISINMTQGVSGSQLFSISCF